MHHGLGGDEFAEAVGESVSTEPAFASVVLVVELLAGAATLYGLIEPSGSQRKRAEGRAGGVMRKLVFLGIALGLAACAESPTAPATARRITPSSAKPGMDITCRSGYIVAYRSDGTQYCAPDGTQTTTSSTNTSTTTSNP
jgi:hypothetical protein